MKTIKIMIEARETDVFKFKPYPAFYKAIGINRKRWGAIFRGESDPLVGELQRIADYFKVDIGDLMDLKGNCHE